MDCRRYNRDVRFHKLLYEALRRLVWKGFIPWLQENHEDSKDVVNAVFNDLKKLQDEPCSEEFEKQMASPLFTQFETIFVLYMHFLRANNGKLSEF